MFLPPPITPSVLKAELDCLGRYVTERALTDWRSKGLLPPLKSRGRGARRGRAYFWRSPALVEQAITAQGLLARKYPNDEIRFALWAMGFPIMPTEARDAWLSRLSKLKLNLEFKKVRARKCQDSEFSTLEDEISALATPIARKLAMQFGLDRSEITQPVIDLFGLTFGVGYVVEVEALELIIDLMNFGLPILTEAKSSIGDQAIFVVLQFIKNHMSFDAVQEIVKSANDRELI